MAGFAIHVGINRVDPTHYGTSGILKGCENDAHDMQAISRAAGFSSELLLTEQATAARFLERVGMAAKTLVAGDTFLITISSHGSQIPDTLGDEEDGLDETWCFYDRMIIDDEVYAALNAFRSGVKILVISDTCHSLTVTRELEQLRKTPQGRDLLGPVEVTAFRCLADLPDDFFDRHETFYHDIKLSLTGQRSLSRREIDSSVPVLLLAACQDNETASDGADNGLFTGALKTVWAAGAFKGNYRDFISRISATLNNRLQHPGLFPYGADVERLIQQQPFAITAADPARGPTNEGLPKHVVTLDIPARLITDLEPFELAHFLINRAVPLISEASNRLGNISTTVRALPTGSGSRSVEVGCHTDGHEVHCDIHVSRNF